jgi:hypothetical protein
VRHLFPENSSAVRCQEKLCGGNSSVNLEGQPYSGRSSGLCYFKMPAAAVLPLLPSLHREMAIPDDDQILDEMQQAAFLFFWEQADANTGQVKDRALPAGNDSSTVSSIASTGFGLTALCICAQRSYQPASSILSRVQTTLNFLLYQMPEQNGFFFHFVGMSSGTWAFPSIDAAILL